MSDSEEKLTLQISQLSGQVASLESAIRKYPTTAHFYSALGTAAIVTVTATLTVIEMVVDPVRGSVQDLIEQKAVTAETVKEHTRDGHPSSIIERIMIVGGNLKDRLKDTEQRINRIEDQLTRMVAEVAAKR